MVNKPPSDFDLFLAGDPTEFFSVCWRDAEEEGGIVTLIGVPSSAFVIVGGGLGILDLNRERNNSGWRKIKEEKITYITIEKKLYVDFRMYSKFIIKDAHR